MKKFTKEHIANMVKAQNNRTEEHKANMTKYQNNRTEEHKASVVEYQNNRTEEHKASMVKYQNNRTEEHKASMIKYQNNRTDEHKANLVKGQVDRYNNGWIITDSESYKETIRSRPASWRSEATSRASRGSNQNGSKLTERIVWEFRFGNLMHLRPLGKFAVRDVVLYEFGIEVSTGAVYSMMRGISWKHVTSDYYTTEGLRTEHIRPNK